MNIRKAKRYELLREVRLRWKTLRRRFSNASTARHRKARWAKALSSLALRSLLTTGTPPRPC